MMHFFTSVFQHVFQGLLIVLQTVRVGPLELEDIIELCHTNSLVGSLTQASFHETQNCCTVLAQLCHVLMRDTESVTLYRSAQRSAQEFLWFFSHHTPVSIRHHLDRTLRSARNPRNIQITTIMLHFELAHPDVFSHPQKPRVPQHQNP